MTNVWICAIEIQCGAHCMVHVWCSMLLNIHTSYTLHIYFHYVKIINSIVSFSFTFFSVLFFFLLYFVSISHCFLLHHAVLTQCMCVFTRNKSNAWLVDSIQFKIITKKEGDKKSSVFANENGKLTITGNQCWCKRTAREKGKQIINCAMLHLSPEKLYLLLWILFALVLHSLPSFCSQKNHRVILYQMTR